jgi:hypothetical protein
MSHLNAYQSKERKRMPGKDMMDTALTMTRRDMLRLSGAAGMGGLMSRESFSATSSQSKILSPPEKTVRAKDAIDHLIFGIADLDQGIAWVEQKTGVKAVIGGVHPGAGTRNALLSFGRRQYLEIISLDPAQQTQREMAMLVRTLTTPKLITWAAGTTEIDAVAQQARAAGYEIAGPFAGSRNRPDGKTLNWKTMHINHNLGGVIPFFIEWDSETVHPSVDSPAGCRITGLEIAHPAPEQVREMLRHLGIEATVKRGREAALKAVLSTPKGKVVLT